MSGIYFIEKPLLCIAQGCEITHTGRVVALCGGKHSDHYIGARWVDKRPAVEVPDFDEEESSLSGAVT